MHSANSFVEAATEYCAWAESEPAAPETEARVALRLLARLYADALSLEPYGDINDELEGENLSHENWKPFFSRFGALPFNYYGVVFDPQTIPPQEPVVGDLADDLADIYRDLLEGLSLERAGHHGEAIHAWRQSFQNHWGAHAASGIRALHAWFEQETSW